MMKKIVLASAVALLAACGSTSVVKQPMASIPANSTMAVSNVVVATPKDGDQPPPYFIGVVGDQLKADLSRTNRVVQEANADVTVDVKVTGYRMRSPATRIALGILAGKDGVESEVTLKEKSGRVLGSSVVSSYNISAYGSAEDIARMHGEEIAKFVASANQAR